MYTILIGNELQKRNNKFLARDKKGENKDFQETN